MTLPRLFLGGMDAPIRKILEHFQLGTAICWRQASAMTQHGTGQRKDNGGRA
jgi:hypothetical protein